MSISEGWTDRRRAHEDEYFRRRDRELAETARLRARDEAARDRLAERAGVFDHDLLRHLQVLGYTADTVMLLNVMPLLDVAWADGQVSDPERDVIVAAARSHGVAPGCAADVQLAEWLFTCPSDGLRHDSLRVLDDVLRARPADLRETIVRDLLSSCRAVASAAGGVCGFHRISNRERNVLDRISAELWHKTDAPNSGLAAL